MFDSEEVRDWALEKMLHYYNAGWTKAELELKFDIPWKTVIDYLEGYGENVLGHKDEPYFETEEEMIYVPPTYKDLSPSERKIYRQLK